MLLKELSPGARGRIVALRKEQPEYRRRLLMASAPRPAPNSKWSASHLWAIRLKSAFAAA